MNQVCPFDRLPASVLFLPLASPFVETLPQRMELTTWSSDQLSENCWGAYEKHRLHPRPKKIRIFIATRFASGSYACKTLRICVPVVQDVRHSKQAVLINTPLSVIIGYCVSIDLKSWRTHTVVFILSSTEPSAALKATIRFI